MNPDEHPEGTDNARELEGQAAELQRKRDALDAEQQQLERELQKQELTRQEEALEQQRRDLEAQRQAMESEVRQLHLEREHEEQLLLSLAARELLPAEAPEPQGRNPGVIAGIGIAMLAIGAAVGWFGYSVLTDDEDAIAQVVDADSTDAAFGQLNGTLAETSSATTGTTTAIPAATIASSVWAHPDGTLQANLPDDWVPSWQSRPWP